MKKFIKLILAASLVVGFSSCLKDKNYDEDKTGHNLDGVPKIIELAVEFEPGHDKALAVDFKDATIPVTFVTVRLAATEPATEDISVTLDTTFTKAQLDTFNVHNGAAVIKLPQAFYTIPGGLTVIIPKGSREVKVNILTNPINYDPSTTYGLAFKLKSVNTPGYTLSKNYGEWITTIGAKNSYDGIYSVISGNVQRYTAGVPEPPGGLNGSLAGNDDVYLVTTGANYNNIPPSSPAVPGRLLWAFGANSAVAGIDGLRVTVDPATNLVTMSSSGNATLTNWAGKVNKYDPATRTFYLAFRWNPTGNTREYEIVLKYKGPR